MPVTRLLFALLFVSTALLASAGCEDDNDLRTDVVRFDASPDRMDSADGTSDRPPEGPDSAAEGGSNEPAGSLPPDMAPDEAPDMEPDAGAPTDAPLDGPADQAPETANDGTDGELSVCPGASCPRVIAPGHLQMWLRGDEGVDCEFNGAISRVREWRDQSGKGHHARPLAGKAGPLCGASASKLNERPVLTFPRTVGLEDAEHLEFSLAPIQGGPFTVVVVEKRTHAMDFGTWMIGAALGDTSGDCSAARVSSNRGRVLQIGYQAPFEKRANTWGPSCGAKLNELLVPGARIPDLLAPTETTLWIVARTAEGKLSLAVNGRKLDEAADEGLMTTSPPLTGLIGRGHQRLQYDGRFRGDIAEILLFDVALDDQQQRTLEQHLRSRWGFATAN